MMSTDGILEKVQANRDRMMRVSPALFSAAERAAEETVRDAWPKIVANSDATGSPGITHICDKDGHALEFRDDDGRIRGVLALYPWGELLLAVDPEYRRRGICTRLLSEASDRGIPIDFVHQTYTRAGWATVRRFLERRQ